MAIDPNIAMSFQPVQIQSPLAMAGQVATLRNAGLQQQLGQQALQEGQIRLNQTGQSWQDQQADRAAIQNNMQPDPQTGQVKLNRAGYLTELAQKAPSLSMQRAQEFAMQDFTRSQQQAALTKTQLENAKAHTELIGSVVGTVKDQPSYDQARQTLQQAGIDTSRFPAAYDPQLVQQFAAQAISAKDQAEQHLAALKAQEDARHNTVTEATGQQTAAAATQRGQAAMIDARNSTVRTGIEQGRFNLERQYMPAAGAGVTGDAFLQTLNPGIQQQIKSIANGDVKMPPARSGAGMQMRNAVLQYDPTFTDARYTGKQQFKTGADATAIQQSAAMLEHLDRSLQNSQKLGNSAALATGFPSADAAAYKKDVQFYTGELGKLVTGGMTTEGEGNRLLSDLQSPVQNVRDAALNEMTQLAKGNVSAKMQKYKNATGQDLPVDQFFDKQTQGRLQKFGFQTAPAAAAASQSGVSVTAPDGSVHIFPNADAAAKFKTLAGIK
jgi:hypothetical protein